MGDGVLVRADQLYTQAAELYERGRYGEALPLANEALAIRRAALPEGDPKIATSLNNLALLYKKKGDYEVALPLFQEALAIRRAVLAADHCDVAQSLNNLAELYSSAGNYAAAQPLLEEALAILRAALPAGRFGFATSLSNLAALHHAKGDHAAAEPLFKEALSIYRAELPEGQPNIATSLSNLAALHHAKGDYAAAEPLLEEALGIRRTALPDGHPDIAVSLSNLAGLYGAKGDRAAAQPLLEEALAIRRAALPARHPDIAMSLDDLGALYIDKGDYAEAQPLLEEALEIQRVALPEGHPTIATSLRNLAGLYGANGDCAAVQPLLEEALAIRRAALPARHPDIARSLDDLGVLYKDKGDYAEAQPLLEEALEIARAALPEGHPTIATSLNSLALLYQDKGDYAVAQPLLEEALEIDRAALPERQREFATVLDNLAGLYGRQGDTSAAERLSQEALAIFRSVLPVGHPKIATALHNLAGCYYAKGDYEAARPLYQEALAIYRSALPAGHPAIARSLDNLAHLYRAKRDYTAAEPLYQEALEILRVGLPEGHPDIATSLTNRAGFLAATRRPDEAFRLMQEAVEIENALIGQIFAASSERQRMAFLDTLRVTFEMNVSRVLTYFRTSPEAIRWAFDLVLRRKAVGAEALAAQREAVLGGRYPALAPKLQELRAVRAQITRRTLAGPGLDGPDVHRALLAEWAEWRERLETELAREIPEMNLERQLHTVDSETIARALPEEVALIEWVRIGVADFEAASARRERYRKPGRYLAFVLHVGEPVRVHLVDLGEAEEIERLLFAFRSSITGDATGRGAPAKRAGVSDTSPWQRLRERVFDPLLSALGNREATERGAPVERASADDANQGQRLRELVFDPLLAALGDRETAESDASPRRLLLCPDGALCQLPFEALPGKEGGYLLDSYAMSYLTAGRDVLRFGQAAHEGVGTPLVVAAPDFDLGGTGSLGEVSGGATTSRRSRDLDRGNLGEFRTLSHTTGEGKDIAKRLGVEPWLDGEALEGPLKHHASPRILHLATHGFFLADQESEPEARRLGEPLTVGDEGERSPRSLAFHESPLLRSGLALAGANTFLQGGSLPTDAEDGLLTAEDVAGLDLLGTELVVLSACDTGRGEVKVGEGVFGLRRAFTLAGARTLVMSLWKVDDAVTAELMSRFYEGLEKGLPTAEALRAAQRVIRKDYRDPYYWAGFICEGDPGWLHAQREA